MSIFTNNTENVAFGIGCDRIPDIYPVIRLSGLFLGIRLSGRILGDIRPDSRIFIKIDSVLVLKGTVLPNYFFLYYWSDRNQNLWTYIKSKNNWGNSRVLFPIFFIENELFKENGKKGVCSKYTSG